MPGDDVRELCLRECNLLFRIGDVFLLKLFDFLIVVAVVVVVDYV